MRGNTIYSNPEQLCRVKWKVKKAPYKGIFAFSNLHFSFAFIEFF